MDNGTCHFQAEWVKGLHDSFNSPVPCHGNLCMAYPEHSGWPTSLLQINCAKLSWLKELNPAYPDGYQAKSNCKWFTQLLCLHGAGNNKKKYPPFLVSAIENQSWIMWVALCSQVLYHQQNNEERMQNPLNESHSRPDVGELMKGDFRFPLAQQRALSPWVGTRHLSSGKTPLCDFHILHKCEVSGGNCEVNSKQ